MNGRCNLECKVREIRGRGGIDRGREEKDGGGKTIGAVTFRGKFYRKERAVAESGNFRE
jgi:hypothetical protein